MTTLLLHSQLPDAIQHYADLSQGKPLQPLADGSWLVCSYAACQFLLHSPAASVPELSEQAHQQQAPERVRTTLAALARVNNPPAHNTLRRLAEPLFAALLTVQGQPAALMPRLTQWLESRISTQSHWDWIALASELMPRWLLACMGVGEEDTAHILAQLPDLQCIMRPHNTAADWPRIDTAINEISQRLCSSSWLQHTLATAAPAQHSALITALLGMLIQSRDAGRGVLSDTLLAWLRGQISTFTPTAIHEVLRFYSPIQHTRRQLHEGITLCGQSLPAGAQLILLLAQANRDSSVFTHPHGFDSARSNASTHLTFGEGAHQCLARHAAVAFCQQVFVWLQQRYGRLNWQPHPLNYEPLANARLLQQLWVNVCDQSTTMTPDRR